ncbi:hypothetical protein EAH89_19765 [Roseomonas nepalensis]|uniref:Uncharacterized protein n=1 Tax=Muricoccus nepalensis TaxID=1854500 RepID=A0A502FQV5_9PROT|nr:hypothetical protein [Roseomonas nepalensis]TPG51835.1 hypothetical protein EAH89_19765 [Roseomonas nepalensis]
MRRSARFPSYLSVARRQRGPAPRPTPEPRRETGPESGQEAALHAGVMQAGQLPYEAFKLSLLLLAAGALAHLGPSTALQVLLCGIGLAIAVFATAWLGLALCGRVRWRGE